jgi:hypothetical protein
MKFETGDHVEVVGTFLQGCIETTYQKLCEVFGEPTVYDLDSDEKTHAEWDIRFEDGTIATVYDWKNYCDPEDVEEWMIGGKNRRSVDLVMETIGGKS